ncbi:MAG: pseudouridine synthase [Vicinamibacterales bacterium]
MRRPGEVSLERALSKLGAGSRSEARGWILDGRVSLAGRKVTDPGLPVVPETADLRLDGRRLERPAPLTILLHKPRGVVTTRSDPAGRPTVYDLVRDAGRHLGPVGRLDLATSGLLLLTSDTQLAHWISDPANRVPRVYLVTVRGRVAPDAVAALERGVMEGGERLAATAARLRKASARESHLVLELAEGRNREVRRLLDAVGHSVTRLRRVQFGGLALGTLAPGAWRVVTPRELAAAFPGAPLSRR